MAQSNERKLPEGYIPPHRRLRQQPAPAPQDPSSPTLSWPRIVGAGAARVVPPIVGSIGGTLVGGLPGGVAGGTAGGALGEMLAQYIEGRKEKNLGSAAVGGFLGGVPGAAMFKAGRPLLSAAMGGVIAGAGTAGYKASEAAPGSKMEAANPANWEAMDWLGPATGGVISGVLGKVTKPLAAGPKPQPTPKPQLTPQEHLVKILAKKHLRGYDLEKLWTKATRIPGGLTEEDKTVQFIKKRVMANPESAPHWDSIRKIIFEDEPAFLKSVVDAEIDAPQILSRLGTLYDPDTVAATVLAQGQPGSGNEEAIKILEAAVQSGKGKNPKTIANALRRLKEAEVKRTVTNENKRMDFENAQTQAEADFLTSEQKRADLLNRAKQRAQEAEAKDKTAIIDGIRRYEEKMAAAAAEHADLTKKQQLEAAAQAELEAALEGKVKGPTRVTDTVTTGEGPFKRTGRTSFEDPPKEGDGPGGGGAAGNPDDALPTMTAPDGKRNFYKSRDQANQAFGAMKATGWNVRGVQNVGRGMWEITFAGPPKQAAAAVPDAPPPTTTTPPAGGKGKGKGKASAAPIAPVPPPATTYATKIQAVGAAKKAGLTSADVEPITIDGKARWAVKGTVVADVPPTTPPVNPTQPVAPVIDLAPKVLDTSDMSLKDIMKSYKSISPVEDLKFILRNRPNLPDDLKVKVTALLASGKPSRKDVNKVFDEIRTWSTAEEHASGRPAIGTEAWHKEQDALKAAEVPSPLPPPADIPPAAADPAAQAGSKSAAVAAADSGVATLDDLNKAVGVEEVPQPPGSKGTSGLRVGGDETGMALTSGLIRAGTTLGGATIGGAVGAANSEDPLSGGLTGALIGGSAGFLAPTVARAALQAARNKPLAEQQEAVEQAKNTLMTYSKLIPDVYRSNLLLHPVNLPINMWVGPWGSAMMGSLEALAKGDSRGLAAMRALADPVSFYQRWSAKLPEAEDLLTHAAATGEGIAGRMEGPVSSAVGEVPEQLSRTIMVPGKAMTAGDLAAKEILMEAGFSADDAERITLTSEPWSKLFEGVGNLRRTGGPLATMALPFWRTAANQMEQSLERFPVVGIAVERLMSTRTGIPVGTFRAQAAKQGIGTGVMVLSFFAGMATPQENKWAVRKIVDNLGGQYGALASMAFLTGNSYANSEDPVQAISATVAQMGSGDLPLPTGKIVGDLVRLGKAAVGDEEVTVPTSVIPFGNILNPETTGSIPWLVGGMMEPNQVGPSGRPTQPTNGAGRSLPAGYIPPHRRVPQQ